MKKVFFNKALRILLATNAMILIASAMLGPIYALFVEDVGGDLMDASIAAGFFAFAAGVATLISGKYSDKIKQSELVIVFGYVIMGLGFLLYIFVDSIWFLLLVQIITGFGDAIYAPALDSAYSKHLTSHYAGSQWGVWESMNYFTAAIGAIIGGLIVTFLGFNTIFIVMSCLCFGSALFIYRLPRHIL